MQRYIVHKDEDIPPWGKEVHPSPPDDVHVRQDAGGVVGSVEAEHAADEEGWGEGIHRGLEENFGPEHQCWAREGEGHVGRRRRCRWHGAQKRCGASGQEVSSGHHYVHQ